MRMIRENDDVRYTPTMQERPQPPCASVGHLEGPSRRPNAGSRIYDELWDNILHLDSMP